MKRKIRFTAVIPLFAASTIINKLPNCPMGIHHLVNLHTGQVHIHSSTHPPTHIVTLHYRHLLHSASHCAQWIPTKWPPLQKGSPHPQTHTYTIGMKSNSTRSQRVSDVIICLDLSRLGLVALSSPSILPTYTVAFCGISPWWQRGSSILDWGLSFQHAKH